MLVALLVALLAPFIRMPAANAANCQTSYVTRGEAKPGFFVLSMTDTVTYESTFLLVDHHGRCLYEKKILQPAIDLRPHIIANELYFSALFASESISPISLLGTRRIYDRHMGFIKQIQHQLDSMYGPADLDLHEFQLEGLDHYTDLHALPVTDWLGQCVLEPHLTEINGGAEVYSWSTSAQNLPWNFAKDHPGLAGFHDHDCRDVFHLNSFQKVKNLPGYLVSMRVDSWIAFIPTYSPEVAWTLGGPTDEFNLPEEARFTGQHSAIWNESENSLVLLDNGGSFDAAMIGLSSIKREHAARVLKFVLDPQHRKIISWQTIYQFGRPSEKHGNVTLCGPNCYDIAPGAVLDGPTVVEYDSRERKIKFELTLAQTEHSMMIYRVYKVSEGDAKDLTNLFR